MSGKGELVEVTTEKSVESPKMSSTKSHNGTVKNAIKINRFVDFGIKVINNQSSNGTLKKDDKKNQKKKIVLVPKEMNKPFINSFVDLGDFTPRRNKSQNITHSPLTSNKVNIFKPNISFVDIGLGNTFDPSENTKNGSENTVEDNFLNNFVNVGFIKTNLNPTFERTKIPSEWNNGDWSINSTTIDQSSEPAKDINNSDLVYLYGQNTHDLFNIDNISYPISEIEDVDVNNLNGFDSQSIQQIELSDSGYSEQDFRNNILKQENEPSDSFNDDENTASDNLNYGSFDVPIKEDLTKDFTEFLDRFGIKLRNEMFPEFEKEDKFIDVINPEKMFDVVKKIKEKLSNNNLNQNESNNGFLDFNGHLVPNENVADLSDFTYPNEDPDILDDIENSVPANLTVANDYFLSHVNNFLSDQNMTNENNDLPYPAITSPIHIEQANEQIPIKPQAYATKAPIISAHVLPNAQSEG